MGPELVGFDPNVWTDRALQEVFSGWVSGLASMYPASSWSSFASGPSRGLRGQAPSRCVAEFYAAPVAQFRSAVDTQIGEIPIPSGKLQSSFEEMIKTGIAGIESTKKAAVKKPK